MQQYQGILLPLAIPEAPDISATNQSLLAIRSTNPSKLASRRTSARPSATNHREHAIPSEDFHSEAPAWNQRPILAFKTIGLNPIQPLKTKKTNSAIMLTPEFLRRQAENCLRIARTCFDLASAERLRLMAAELNAKAVELEDQNKQHQTPLPTIQRNPSS